MPKNVTMTGEFSGMNLNNISIEVEAMLERIGAEVTEGMRSYTRPHDDTGDLTDSITWRTGATYAPIKNNEDLIEKPDAPNAVDIGSRARHAWFREHGTGPHIHPEGSEEFVAEMKEWASRKGIQWNGTEAEQAQFWAIVNHIRQYGTEAFPFAEPMIPELRSIAQKYGFQAIRNMFEKRKRK